jgi:hypothetical protein
MCTQSRGLSTISQLQLFSKAGESPSAVDNLDEVAARFRLLRGKSLRVPMRCASMSEYDGG